MELSKADNAAASPSTIGAPELMGAEILVKALQAENVQYIWGYPGGAVLYIYDALYKQDTIEHVLVRHEQAAVHAADGYARATGDVGVALVTSGPGLTNAVTGIATAYMDSIPMVIIFMKYGLRQTLLLGVTVGFLMGLFIDPVTALVQFLSFGAVGLALGAGFRYEWSAVRLLGTVTAALVAVFVVIALLSYVVLDVNVFTQMNDFFTQFMDSMMAQYQQQGMSDVKLAETRAQLNQVREMLPSLLPMFLCLGTAIIAYANIKISQVILRRLGFSLKAFLPIRYWEIPRSMIYLYILALVMKYWGVTRDITWLNIIGMNLSQLAYFFLCVQGIALILYLINRRFQLRNGLQALILILFFVMPVFSYAAFLAGIFDMLTNYRKKGRTL